VTTIGARRPSVAIAGVAILGILGWIWLGSVAVALARAPIEPRTGFDLQLLIDAGRDVAAGRSPYDAALIGGTAPVAESLFYSYPPVVAQVVALVSGLPDVLILLLWDGAAVAGLAAIAGLLSRRLRPDRPANPAVVAVLAVAPLCFPFAIGLLFGNFDVFFPVLYGAMLLAALSRGDDRQRAGGAVALAIATTAKLHPGSLGAWFLARGIGGSRAAVRTFLVSVAVAVGLVAASVAIGGLHLWSDYVGVVRAGSNADLIDPDNAGPAVQLALALGRDDAFARTAQIGVTGIVLAVTIFAALRGGDPVERLAWAAAASLATLPVTWYHYPSAMIPFGIAAVLRSDSAASSKRVVAVLATALVVAAAAIVVVPLIWLAIVLVLVAVRLSQEGTSASDWQGAATAVAAGARST
jgi:hypothetical protein